MEKYNFTLGKDRKDWLEEEARRRGLSGMSELLRQWIDRERAIAKEEDKPS